ncbi:MAG TPA: DUF4231 domain-containing protein [Bryobacteraceae bacterium]|jgi:hypothetical protein|nr:DUF4231 domain-containing protein [Bryobacteraceae bacterium]
MSDLAPTPSTARVSLRVANAEQVTLDRLQSQFSWYDRRSRLNRTFYKCMKTATLAAAAIIPGLTTSGVRHGSQWAAGLGVLISVLEGVQQLNQCHVNWTTYRATAEALEREKYFYLSASGPYLKIENPQALLAERIEMLTSQENAKWLASQSQMAEPKTA